MAYQFKSFDGATLPLSMPEDPLLPATWSRA